LIQFAEWPEEDRHRTRNAIHCSSFKEGLLMKKKSRIEIARDIVSSVKREMDKPRLTESVRKGFSAQAAPSAEKPNARSARA
jgi:hypothetical protein